MSQATQLNGNTQANARNATQPEEYVMEETPAPKPRSIPGAPLGHTYRRTSGHWTTNIEGKAAWIPSSPNMVNPPMTGYKKMNSLRSMRNIRRFAPSFSMKKANKTKTARPRSIIKRRTFKKINPNRK